MLLPVAGAVWLARALGEARLLAEAELEAVPELATELLADSEGDPE